MSSEVLTEARNRVKVGSVYEALLLHEHITPPQLQAARQFSEDLATSGALGMADSFESAVEAANNDAAFTATLGSLALCDVDNTRCFIESIAGDWVVLPGYVSLEEFASVVTHCLDSLVPHYGFDAGVQDDPRRILMRQLHRR